MQLNCTGRGNVIFGEGEKGKHSKSEASGSIMLAKKADLS